jgi:hypothetical protein
MNDNNIVIDGKIVDYKVAIQNEGMGEVARIPYVHLRIDSGDETKDMNIGLRDLKRLSQQPDMDDDNHAILQSLVSEVETAAFKNRMKYPV